MDGCGRAHFRLCIQRHLDPARYPNPNTIRVRVRVRSWCRIRCRGGGRGRGTGRCKGEVYYPNKRAVDTNSRSLLQQK
jgi:hypothetical protein